MVFDVKLTQLYRPRALLVHFRPMWCVRSHNTHIKCVLSPVRARALPAHGARGTPGARCAQQFKFYTMFNVHRVLFGLVS